MAFVFSFLAVDRGDYVGCLEFEGFWMFFACSDGLDWLRVDSELVCQLIEMAGMIELFDGLV